MACDAHHASAFSTRPRPVRTKDLRDGITNATVRQHFKAYDGQPLTIPAEAAGPKAEYLEWHRREAP